MTNVLLTGLLILAAYVALKSFRERGAGRVSAVEEAARKATAKAARSQIETLEADESGVYRPSRHHAGEDRG